jgi:hypothetical protein
VALMLEDSTASLPLLYPALLYFTEGLHCLQRAAVHLYTTTIASHRYTAAFSLTSPYLISCCLPMASAPRPTVSLSKVPSVKTLCEDLGIQHASLKDSTVFMDAIHAFRKSCTTSNGSLVATLVDWNLPSEQKELRKAAVKFLDDNGNGLRFWNPTRPWAQPSDLHYPQHRDR